jgi:hypothetical protein
MPHQETSFLSSSQQQQQQLTPTCAVMTKPAGESPIASHHDAAHVL